MSEEIGEAALIPAYAHAKAVKAIDVIEQALGGREALLTALLAAPPDTSLDYVVGAIADPRMDARKLSTICAAGGISLGELLEAFKRGALAPTLAQVIKRVAETTPAVIEDVLARAVPYEETCQACSGSGMTFTIKDAARVNVPCTTCQATGKLIREPDFARQKYVLSDLAGLGPQKVPGVLIDQRDQSKHLSMDVSQQAHARLLGAVDKVLYGRRETLIDPPIDTTPIDAPPDSPDTPDAGGD